MSGLCPAKLLPHAVPKCKHLNRSRSGISTTKGWVLPVRRYLIPILHLSIFIAAASLAAAQSAPPPVNPHATPEARALLAYIDSISGQATLTGQHNYPNDGSRWTDLAYDLTGKYPGALRARLRLFRRRRQRFRALSRPAMIEEVKRQYHERRHHRADLARGPPPTIEPVTFHDSVQGHLTDYEWQQLLTPGTPLYNRWCAQVDVVAGYLRQLRDAHVPVLFRAYHEMNGNWFWWGGRPGKDGSAALYRQIYDRFVNVHHLDNLVWVWNVNAPGGNAGPIADYYPGRATTPTWLRWTSTASSSRSTTTAWWRWPQASPSRWPKWARSQPEVLDEQPRWTYFMTWSEWIHSANYS